MIWFIKSKAGIPIARKEIPISDEELANLADATQPEDIWQSLLQAPPGHTFVIPKDEPNIIKDALLDCFEMLTEKDQMLINAIIWEQTGYPQLAERLRMQHTACLENDTKCFQKNEGTTNDAFDTKGLYYK
jgi:hypothetical protein